MKRHAVAALLVLLVLSDLTWRKRKQERELREYVSSSERYVDIGVDLATVVRDPKGQALVPGAPRLRIVDHHFAGGIYDKRKRQIVAGSQNRRTWYASIAQTEIILHPDSASLGQLIYGSERGGKTETLPMWHYWRWLEHLGEKREGGQTAPTLQRLDIFMVAFAARWDPSWYRYRTSKRLIQCCDGSRIRLVSTHRQSEDQGSPLQGFGFSWGGMDEAQDSIKRFDDMEARGASAKERDGIIRYKQARTATAKDKSEWRDARDKLISSGLWERRQLLGINSPFVSPSFWEQKKATMSPREYERRILAQDVGVELAVYYGWVRERNLVASPRIATDVTAAVLAPYARPTRRFSLLVGHDPGAIYNTSVVMKLLMFGAVPTWVVVGELQSKQTTAREHAAKLKAYLKSEFGAQNERYWAAIFVDPHGKGVAETDYQSVYMAFQEEGLDALNPAPVTGKIKRSARIEMENRLLGGSAENPGTPRLVVGIKDGAPCAPVLVSAFESLQKKPGDDNPEGTQRKDEDDKTHAPAALAYCLWPFEQEAYTANTVRLAMAEAKRVTG